MAEPSTTPASTPPTLPEPELGLPDAAAPSAAELLAAQAKAKTPAPVKVRAASAPAPGGPLFGGSSSSSGPLFGSSSSTAGPLLEPTAPRELMATTPGPRQVTAETEVGTTILPGDPKVAQQYLDPQRGRTTVESMKQGVNAFTRGLVEGFGEGVDKSKEITYSLLGSAANAIETADLPRRWGWYGGAGLGQYLPDPDSKAGAAIKSAIEKTVTTLVPATGAEQVAGTLPFGLNAFAAHKFQQATPDDSKALHELQGQMAGRLYDFVSTGAAYKAAVENQDYTAALQYVPFVDNYSANLTGKRVVDAMITKEEAQEAITHTQPKTAERVFYTLLSNDGGREIVGMMIEMAGDPLNLVGIGEASRLVKLGDKSFRVAADVAKGAVVMGRQGVNETEAVRLLVRVARGDAEAFDALRAAVTLAKDNATKARAVADAAKTARTDGELLQVAHAGLEAGTEGRGLTKPWVDGLAADLRAGGKTAEAAREGTIQVLGHMAREAAGHAADLERAFKNAKAGKGVSEASGIAVHAPFGQETFYPLRPLTAPVAKGWERVAPLLDAGVAEVDKIVELYKEGGLKALQPGEQLALATLAPSVGAARAGQKILDLPMFALNMIARHVGSRAIQPLYVQLTNLPVLRDYAALDEMIGSPTLADNVRRIKKSSPEIWEKYQGALTKYLTTRAARASGLRHAMSRVSDLAVKAARVASGEAQAVQGAAAIAQAAKAAPGPEMIRVAAETAEVGKAMGLPPRVVQAAQDIDLSRAAVAVAQGRASSVEDFFARISRVSGGKAAPGAFFEGGDKPLAPTFYSALRRAVESIKQEKMSAEQMLTMVKASSGVKAEEIEWTFFKDFLESHPKVTKTEALAWLDANAVKVEIVRRGQNKEYNAWIDQMHPLRQRRINAWQDLSDLDIDLNRLREAHAAAQRSPVTADQLRTMSASRDAITTELHSLQTDLIRANGLDPNNAEHAEAIEEGLAGDWTHIDPDEAEYANGVDVPLHNNLLEKIAPLKRELRRLNDIIVRASTDYAASIKTAETMRSALVQEAAAADAALDAWQKAQPVQEQATKWGLKDYEHESLELPNGEDYFEIVATLPQGYQDNANEAVRSASELGFRSNHWPEDNPVVHYRANIRTASNGKKYVFLEEVQSDLHQKGYELGYIDPDIGREQMRETLDDRDKELALALNEVVAEAAAKFGFKPSQMKPILRRAIEDDLGVFTAAVPDRAPIMPYAERYKKISDERQTIMAQISKLNEQPIDAPFKAWHELALKQALREVAERNLKGEDIAGLAWTKAEHQRERYKRMIPDQKPTAYNFTYDQEIPSFLNKQGKPFGARTSEVEIPLGPPIKDEYDDWAERFSPEDFGPAIERAKAAGDTEAASLLRDLAHYAATGEAAPWPALGVDARAQAFMFPGQTYTHSTKVWAFDVPKQLQDDVLYKGQRLFQKEKGAIRGAIEPIFASDGSLVYAVQRFFKTADVRTLLHENAHFLRFFYGDAWTDELAKHFDHVVDASGKVSLTRMGEEQAADALTIWQETRQHPGGKWATLRAQWREGLTELWRGVKGLFGQREAPAAPSALLSFWDRALKETPWAGSGPGSSRTAADIIGEAIDHIERGSGAFPPELLDHADELRAAVDDFLEGNNGAEQLEQVKQALAAMSLHMQGDPETYETLIHQMRGQFPKIMQHFTPYIGDPLPKLPAKELEALIAARPTVPLPLAVEGPKGSRELRAWEVELWKHVGPALQGLTEHEQNTVVLGLLADSNLLPHTLPGYDLLKEEYPQVLGQRFGNLPAHLTAVHAELVRIRDANTELVRKFGLAPILDPVTRAQRFGTVGYFPHVADPHYLTGAQKVKAAADMVAGAGRATAGGSVSSALNTAIDSARQREIRGTFAEINAMMDLGNRASKVQLTADPLMLLPRFAQTTNAASAVELLWMLFDQGVAKVFKPELGKSAAALAAAEDFVPLLARPRPYLDYHIALFGSLEEIKAAGIGSADLQAAVEESRRALAVDPVKGTRLGTWVYDVPLIEHAHEIEHNLMLVRAAQLERGLPLLDLSQLAGRDLDPHTWDLAAEMFSKAARDVGHAYTVTGTELATYLGERGAGSVYLPAGVVQNLHDVLDSSYGGALGKVKDFIDPIASWFKRRITSMVIAFNTRNATWNELFANMMTIGPSEWFNLKHQLQATQLTVATGMVARYGSLEDAQRILRSASIPGESALEHAKRMKDLAIWEVNHLDGLAAGGTILGDGVWRTGTDAVNELLNRGIVNDAYSTFADAHLFYNNLLDMLAATTPDRAWDTTKKVASTVEDVVWVGTSTILSGGVPVALPKNVGSEIAQFIEARSRVMNFIGTVNKTKSLDEAQAMVAKALFNYEDLTGFQRTWLRSIQMFFTWPAKNLAFVGKLVMERPALFSRAWRLFFEDVPMALEQWQAEEHGREGPGLYPTDPARQELLDVHERGKIRLAIPSLDHAYVLGLGSNLESAVETASMLSGLAKLVNPLDDTTLHEAWENGDAARMLSTINILPAILSQLLLGRHFYYGKPLAEVNNAATATMVIQRLHSMRDLPIVGPYASAMNEAFKDSIGYTAFQTFNRTTGKAQVVAYADPEALFLLNQLPYRLSGAAAVSDTMHLDMLTVPASGADMPSFEAIPAGWRYLDALMSISVMQQTDAVRMRMLEEQQRQSVAAEALKAGVITEHPEYTIRK